MEMKRITRIVLPVVAGMTLLASSAMAKTHGVSCEKIRTAMDSGKTQSQVAKDLKTPLDHVKYCSMQAQSKK